MGVAAIELVNFHCDKASTGDSRTQVEAERGWGLMVVVVELDFRKIGPQMPSEALNLTRHFFSRQRLDQYANVFSIPKHLLSHEDGHKQ